MSGLPHRLFPFEPEDRSLAKRVRIRACRAAGPIAPRQSRRSGLEPGPAVYKGEPLAAEGCNAVLLVDRGPDRSPSSGWHWHLAGVQQVARRFIRPVPSAALVIAMRPGYARDEFLVNTNSWRGNFGSTATRSSVGATWEINSVADHEHHDPDARAASGVGGLNGPSGHCSGARSRAGGPGALGSAAA